MVDELQAAGFRLPPSSGLKGGKAKLLSHETTINMADKSTDKQTQKMKELLGSNLREQCRLAFEADLKKKKQELENQRKRDQDSIANNKSAFGNISYPTYKWVGRLQGDREVDAPPASLF